MGAGIGERNLLSFDRGVSAGFDGKTGALHVGLRDGGRVGSHREEGWGYVVKDVREQAPAEVHRRYLEAGELGFQRCDGCGRPVFYPRVLCPACGGVSLSWETSAGHGVVYAATAVHRRDAEPYNVSLIDLDEGFRMMSRVADLPAEGVQIGARVRLSVSREEDGPVPVFVLAESETGA